MQFWSTTGMAGKYVFTRMVARSTVQVALRARKTRLIYGRQPLSLAPTNLKSGKAGWFDMQPSADYLHDEILQCHFPL